MRTKSVYIIIFFALTLNVFSQTPKNGGVTLDDADEHFSHTNYLMAIPIYKAQLRENPQNFGIKFKLGVCYLRTRINREESIKYLEDYVKNPKYDEEAWIHLGKAYMLNDKIDEAIKAFEKYKTLKPKKESDVARLLENCNNAKALMQRPINVTFQNLGKEINSDDPDYYPFINEDETFLTFTSRRKDGIGGKKVELDGYHPSDIYFSKVENGKWTKATNAGKIINGMYDEQAVGLKSDGLEMYVYEDHIEKFGDLYISSRKDLSSEFMKPKLCDPIINEKVETSGCLSEDGYTMFFARKDKLSENSDLYVCRKLPTGKWGQPQRLPDVINSKYNEDFPYLLNDGVTLFFSSEGHNSMGGYDLFKTTWNPETNVFSKPENLGYPLNTTDDDRNICVTPDDRVAYVSAFRPGGLGDLDIYRVKFNDHDQLNKRFIGKVFMEDTIPAHQPKTFVASIVVTNKKTKKELLYSPHSKTGKFVLSLPVGKYVVSVTADGYHEYTEEITVSDIGRVDMEKKKNFILQKK
jgi:tetratricopeptide (TPR) repeat protein